jgi:insertion element IS1 protein InsB
MEFSRESITWSALPWLEPCGIAHVYTDGWSAYARHIDLEPDNVGQAHTHTIDRTHLNRRTRITPLVGRPRGISNTATRHDLVMGLCIYREACGRLV